MEDIVAIITIGGEEWLFMKAFPVDCVFIRGTTADTRGNVTMEREALIGDALAMAMASRNSGGRVIVQVERVANPETINPHAVIVPGILVDYVVVAQPELHMQTFGSQYRSELCGEIRVPLTSVKPLPLDERKVIARRANLELRPYDVINLGIGYPEAVSAIANEENILSYQTMTVEPGIIGGMPLGGLDFGSSINPEAVVSMPDQFGFYDGGGWMSPASASPRSRPTATSTRASSVPGWRAAASSTSARMRNECFSWGPSPPAGSRCPWKTAGCASLRRAGSRSSSPPAIRSPTARSLPAPRVRMSSTSPSAASSN